MVSWSTVPPSTNSETPSVPKLKTLCFWNRRVWDTYDADATEEQLLSLLDRAQANAEIRALKPRFFIARSDLRITAVDSRTGQTLEDVEGVVVRVGGDVGVVAVSASGHGYVDASGVGGTVKIENGAVDGAALGRVAGLGVAEFGVGLDVVVREPDPARWAEDGEVAVAIDGVDGPAVSVADGLMLVGGELPVFRRVTTSSPIRSSWPPVRTVRPRVESSPASSRRCWAAAFNSRAVSLLGVASTTVSPSARACHHA